MFEAFRDFFHSIAGAGSAPPGRLGPDDPQVAAAALLYHVAAADGIVTAAELARLRSSVAAEFALDDEAAERILQAGREADLGAVDLYRFTSVLAARLDEARRVRFVELLWDMTYADGAVHELEDNTIWRVAELLGVSTRERMLMKARAAGRTGGGGGDRNPG